MFPIEERRVNLRFVFFEIRIESGFIETQVYIGMTSQNTKKYGSINDVYAVALKHLGSNKRIWTIIFDSFVILIYTAYVLHKQSRVLL